MSAGNDHTTPGYQLFDDWIRVYFAAGSSPAHADYHYAWLRHNCDKDRHPQTNERILCLSKIPASVRPRYVKIAGEGTLLQVLWEDGISGHESIYKLDWLRENAYAPEREEVAPPRADLSRVEIHTSAFGSPEDLRDEALRLVKRFGLAVVRGYGPETEQLIDLFAAGGLFVRGTHFGRIEDLRTDNTTNQNTDQLGYTDAPVDLHTDQPFLEVPPEFQLLQSMRPASSGGENYLADAQHTAQYLKSIDRNAYELLSTIPIRFHRKQKNFEKELISPLFSTDADGQFIVRYSYFTMAPHQAPFDQMEAWYRAYTRFANLVNDKRNQYHFALSAGDFVFYNNRRMLHARTGFTGARWVRGIYFDYAEQPANA